MRLPLLSKAVRTLREDGFRKFLRKSVRYILHTSGLNPMPTVSDGSPPLPVWYLKHVYNLLFILTYGSGVDVMEEDWDTLILLDACRYDDFKISNSIPGELNSRFSQGVDSDEFIRKNFVGEDLSDTVYVTANPHVKLIDDGVFHDVITEPISNWDSELQCVRPEQVTSSALKAHEQYPNKRIIVHYMQPHDPPLGSTADELRNEFEIGWAAPQDDSPHGNRIMELVAAGKISEEKARCAYRETLEIVLDEVSSLIQECDGKVVISADHGEMFGEQPYPLLGRLYEHCRNPKTTELCKVPWFVVDPSDGRRETNSDNRARTSNHIDSDVLDDQLEYLGYK